MYKFIFSNRSMIQGTMKLSSIELNKFSFITKVKLNFYTQSSKIIISSKMEPLKEPLQRLVSQKEEEELNKLTAELGINDKNMPDVPTKNVRTVSFGGRIRIAALTCSDAEKWIDKVIVIGGWARTVRVQGGGDFAFIDLNDGSTIKNLQIIVTKELPNYAEIIKEGIGSCLQLKGLVVKSPGSKQPVRIICLLFRLN